MVKVSLKQTSEVNRAASPYFNYKLTVQQPHHDTAIRDEWGQPFTIGGQSS